MPEDTATTAGADKATNIAANRDKRAKAKKVFDAQRRRRLSAMRFSQIFLGTKDVSASPLDLVPNYEIDILLDEVELGDNEEEIDAALGAKLDNPNAVVGMQKITLHEAMKTIFDLRDAEAQKAALDSLGAEAPAEQVAAAQAKIDQLKPKAAFYTRHAGREMSTFNGIIEQQAKRVEQNLATDVIRGVDGAAEKYMGSLSEGSRKWHNMRLNKARRNAVNNANRDEQKYLLRQENQDTGDRARARRKQLLKIHSELGNTIWGTRGVERRVGGGNREQSTARLRAAATINLANPDIGPAPLDAAVLRQRDTLEAGLGNLQRQLAALGPDGDATALNEQIAAHRQRIAAIDTEHNRRTADATVGRTAVDAFSQETQRDRLEASRATAASTKEWKISEAEKRVLGLSAHAARLKRAPGHFLNGLKYAALSVAEAAGIDVAPAAEVKGAPKKSGKKHKFVMAPPAP